ncbi:unnamed protein product [Ceutorhynchus assimilis]|uniref:Uncharacterized protein n=1 Tax=Ceutorhynchus assimilis TaxID=467358 RepID=A0A9N9MEM0_9CUCU|nr:unnamed protein product [Ceutorhynchus assimilis]
MSKSSEDIQLQTKPRKKAKLISTPTIPEDEAAADFTTSPPTFTIEKETKNIARKSSDASRISTMSTRSAAKVSYTYDNKGFEIRNDSGNDSIRSISRAPSLRSLEVHKEQYCCCSRRTKYERFLLVVVTILAIIVTVLVIVIIYLAKQNKLKSLFKI